MAIPSKKTVLELQRILNKEYGAKLTYEESYEAATNLIGFFDLLARLDFEDRQTREGNR